MPESPDPTASAVAGSGSGGTAGSAPGGTAGSGSGGTAGSGTGGTAGSGSGGTAGSGSGGTAGSGPGPNRLLARVPITVLRILQFTIDLAVLVVACLAPLALTLLLPTNPDGTTGALLVAIPLMLLVLVLCTVLSWWLWVRWPARHAGQTLAMRWLGLAVVAADGSPATTGQLAARWLMLVVDGMFFGAVGLASILLTPKRQRLGDVVADTVVVRTTGADAQASAAT